MLKDASRKNLLSQHFHGNTAAYFIVISCFVLGVVFGGMSVNILSTERCEAIRGGIISAAPDNAGMMEIFKSAMLDVFVSAGLLWAFGLMMVGAAPIVLFSVYRGYSTGFTIGFLFRSLGEKGIYSVLLGVAPANLFIVFGFLAAAIFAFTYSLRVARGESSFSDIVPYSLIFLLILMVMILGAAAEGFVCTPAVPSF